MDNVCPNLLRKFTDLNGLTLRQTLDWKKSSKIP